MCTCPENYIKFTKVVIIRLIVFSEYPGVFVPESEINYDENMNPPSISFYQHANVSSCSLNKQPLSENGKTFPL